MQKINFQNLPNTTTPINATNLNQLQTNIENAIPANSSFTLAGLGEKSYNNLTDKPELKTVATTGSYNDLTNKPTIPTVNNATLTIQQNGSNVATFTANASSNVTANITVPTLPTTTTGTGIVTRSSGATLNSSSYAKYGNVVTLDINLTTSSSTSAGSNVFTGTINSNTFYPKASANGTSFNGSCGILGYINTSGDITIRVIGATLATSKTFDMVITYVI